MKQTWSLLVGVVIIAAGPGYCAETSSEREPEQPPAVSGPMQKLERGVANTAAGWMYLPRAFKDCYTRVGGLLHENTPLLDGPRCAVDATWRILGREVWGVTELVTFPIRSWPKPNYRSPYGWGDYPWDWIHVGRHE